MESHVSTFTLHQGYSRTYKSSHHNLGTQN
jgi:hypothetical protein